MTQLAFAPVKTTPKDADTVSHRLLVQGAFVDQVMAGVYTFLPFGLRVLAKIENIVREEMDKIGNEILMPTLEPVGNWKQTGRFEKVDVLMKAVPANQAAKDKHDAEYVIGPIHEEIVTPLVKKFNFSYKNLPRAVYQKGSRFLHGSDR